PTVMLDMAPFLQARLKKRRSPRDALGNDLSGRRLSGLRHPTTPCRRNLRRTRQNRTRRSSAEDLRLSFWAAATASRPQDLVAARFREERLASRRAKLRSRQRGGPSSQMGATVFCGHPGLEASRRVRKVSDVVQAPVEPRAEPGEHGSTAPGGL